MFPSINKVLCSLSLVHDESQKSKGYKDENFDYLKDVHPTVSLTLYDSSSNTTTPYFQKRCRFSERNSRFTIPALYKLCDKESVYYVIPLKSNANLQRTADGSRPSFAPTDTDETEVFYAETEYRAKSWACQR